MRKLFSRVLEKIKPTDADIKRDGMLLEKLIQDIRRVVPNAEVAPLGSFAKGTNLKNERDIDVFVMVDKNVGLESILAKIREIKGYKWISAYAEHPYLRTFFGGVKFDVVPCYKIKRIDEMASSVDRSQLHLRYIKESLSEKQKDDVRLLKQFMKGIGVYGAELAVEGFSGYVCELLIVKYKTFSSVISEAAGWREPVFVDLTGKGSLFNAPITIIDPVDTNRNAAAVVSKTSLAKFVTAARAFIKKPSENFFFPKRRFSNRQRREAFERIKNCICIAFKKPKLIDDVLYPQLRKTAEKIAAHAEDSSFKLIGHSFAVDAEKDRCYLLFEFEVRELSPYLRIRGPFFYLTNNAEDFVKVHKTVFIEGDRLHAIERRKYTKAEDLLRYMMEDAEKFGVPENIRRMLRNAEFISDPSLVFNVFFDYFTGNAWWLHD
ncbi:MAG: CCA tRNA nucleotidyltransferase [Candidatus Micrarchaeia archaeon]